MYPSISDYISSIESAADTLNALNYLRPVLKPNGQPYFSSGNFAVVFKMQDTRTGNHMALKCFLRDVPDRARRLRLIGEWIADNPSPYLLPMTYHADELWVDCAHCDREEFDVVMMPWVEGQTLGEYVRGLCTTDRVQNSTLRDILTGTFNRMACWLLEHPFAHGDLKPDNILVDNCHQLMLVDYDGCFVPTLINEKANETGTPPYQHPLRNFNHFDQHIDDFAILVISLELHTIAQNQALFSGVDSIILLADTLINPFKSTIWEILRALKCADVSARAGMLEHALHREDVCIDSLGKFIGSYTELPNLIPEVLPIVWTVKGHFIMKCLLHARGYDLARSPRSLA